MVRVETEYISIGGNRHPGGADWDVRSGVLAYGADNNVALWAPKVYISFSICRLSFYLSPDIFSLTAEFMRCSLAIATKSAPSVSLPTPNRKAACSLPGL